MCLRKVFAGYQKQKVLNKLPENGYYWKTVKAFNHSYWSIFYSYVFEPGINITEAKEISFLSCKYLAAFHLFRTKKDAILFSTQKERVIRCKVKKSNIVAIGEQKLWLCDKGQYIRLLTIVAKELWMPKFRK